MFINVETALNELEDLESSLWRKVASPDMLIAELSAVTGLSGDEQSIEHQLASLAEKYGRNNVWGEPSKEEACKAKLEETIAAAKCVSSYFDSGYFQLVTTFRENVGLFGQVRDVGNFELSSGDRHGEWHFYEWTNVQTGMRCSIPFDRFDRRVIDVWFRLGDTSTQFTSTDMTRRIYRADGGYPKAEMTWMGQRDGLGNLGKLRFLRIDLSDQEFVNWEYRQRNHRYERWVPRDHVVPAGAPETIEGLTKVFGLPIDHQIEYEETFRNLREQSGFDELIGFLQNMAKAK